jgi:hypothetical protein
VLSSQAIWILATSCCRAIRNRYVLPVNCVYPPVPPTHDVKLPPRSKALSISRSARGIRSMLQVQVCHEGKVYWPGEVADVPDHVARGWLRLARRVAPLGGAGM